MTASVPSWPCRHLPPCTDESQHWEVCGCEWPDAAAMSDPVCRDCGWPGASCTCNDEDADEQAPLVRNEIVVTQKPGHVVVQVSESVLEALKALRRGWSEPLAGDTCRMLWRDLAVVLKETP